MNGHRSDIAKNRKSLPIVEHFNKCALENLRICGIEKCRSKDTFIRKARETFYIKEIDPQINKR